MIQKKLTLFFLILAIQCYGQENNLTIENLLSIVKMYHPIVKQSNLQNDIANNQLTISKSVFDPSFQYSSKEKLFDNKLYYKNNLAEIKIPTWYGLDFKAGVENNTGENIDPTLTKNLSSYFGVNIDPFRGILIDKRKAVVTQAKNFIDLTKNEQTLVINDLILDATSAYWNWVSSYYNLKILKKSVQNNKERFDVIKNSYLSGDRAPIDTIEAMTQLQTFEILETQANLELQKSKNELSNFCWTELGLPYELSNTIQPDSQFENNNVLNLDLDKLENLLQTGTNFHPKIKMVENKLNILNLEKRLKLIELFPNLKMEYNILDNNNDFKNIVNNYNKFNNYKYGISISMPLFQRQTRGDIAKTKNKIEEQNWNKRNIILEIDNKIKNYYSEFYSLKQQLKTNEKILLSNKLLFDAENSKFKLGESSLFLINSRELKYIETEQKTVALKTKLFNTFYKVFWATGTLQ